MKSAFILLFSVACGGSDPVAPAPKPAPAPAAVEEPAPAPEAAAPEAGTPAGAADSAAGKEVYTTYCQACHQADGSGMNGMLAANFKDDPARLAQPDDVLIGVIKDGKTGTVGTMPPWGETLSDQEVVNVLAYVKETFGQ